MVYCLCRRQSTVHGPRSAFFYMGYEPRESSHEVFIEKSMRERKGERGFLQVDRSSQHHQVILLIASARVFLILWSTKAMTLERPDSRLNPPCTRFVTSAAILGSNSTAMTFFAFSSILTVRLPVPGPTSRTIYYRSALVDGQTEKMLALDIALFQVRFVHYAKITESGYLL